MNYLDGIQKNVRLCYLRRLFPIVSLRAFVQFPALISSYHLEHLEDRRSLIKTKILYKIFSTRVNRAVVLYLATCINTA